MEQITIRIRDPEKAQMLLELLRSLDFVDSVETDQNGSQVEDDTTNTSTRQQQFMALAGLWAGQEIDLDSIRHKAWPRQAP